MPPTHLRREKKNTKPIAISNICHENTIALYSRGKKPALKENSRTPADKNNNPQIIELNFRLLRFIFYKNLSLFNNKI